MQEKIGIVGLGYVGLPLAATFAKKFKVVGFDKSAKRIEELQNQYDRTNEVAPRDLQTPGLCFTSRPKDLADCTFIIVAVPTPIDEQCEPDLTYVKSASETVGKLLKPGMLVAYESTVYPGVTEEECLPILESESGLTLGDFDLAYSPERVNPGDKEHTIDKIVKIVSGHDAKALERAAAVYGKVVSVGIHKAPTIKTAEAAKVIENVQRDLNIALLNELSKIFERMDIHTPDVIEAAGTKWNFHKYQPGLVGGHCIGVDPYYLTRRATQLGYHPEVILSGRKINDGMGAYVANQMINLLKAAKVPVVGAEVWVLGLTFKENVPDFRNTRAIDVIQALQAAGVQVYVWEPMVSAEEIEKQFRLETRLPDEVNNLDGIVLINAHNAYRDLTLENLKPKMKQLLLVDVKNYFEKYEARKLGYTYKSL